MSKSYPMTTDDFASKLENFKNNVDGAINVFLNLPEACATIPNIIRDATSYKKVGGLHFAKIGEASISWSFKKKFKSSPVVAPATVEIEPVSDILNSRISRFVTNK